MNKLTDKEILQEWEDIEKQYRKQKKDFFREHRVIMEELENLKKEITQHAEDGDLNSVERRQIVAKRLLMTVPDEEVKKEWEEFNHMYRNLAKEAGKKQPKKKERKKEEKRREQERVKDEQEPKPKEEKAEKKKTVKMGKVEVTPDEKALLEKYEAESGKHAVWRGSITKQYKEWKKSQGRKE